MKKVIKRGRPRKHRPGMDDRIDKANRTRKRLNEQGQDHQDATSSGSSCSMSSWGSPPTDTLESFSIQGGSPQFDDMALFDNHLRNAAAMDTMGLPPDFFTFTPPASPGYSTGNKPSPQRHLQSLTPTDPTDIPAILAHEIHDLPTSDMHEVPPNLPQTIRARKLHTSNHTPPSLSHSGSSPLVDVAAFDFSDDLTMSGQRIVSKNESIGADFDSFLDFSNMGLDPNADSFFAGL